MQAGITRRQLLTAAALAAAAPLLPRPAAAQGTPWPQAQPIRVIVPFGAGGATDIAARVIAQEMQATLGQTLVMENRGGAGSTLGTGFVARMPPDGYTLLITTISGLAIGQTLYRDRIQYNADTSFEHIAIMMGTPYLLCVNPNQPIRDVAGYVAAAKAGPMFYGTSGAGGVAHLLGMRLAAATGAPLEHVPYRGSAQAITDLMAGVVPSVLDSLTATSAHIKSGALRPLATTAPERSPDFPDVPTFRELGYPEVVADGWAGLAAPAGTPRPILEKLAEAVRSAQASPNVQRRFAETSTTAGRLYLADAQKFVRDEIAAWAPVIRASGITPD
ncbi:tripartite tricarboxylate transporter substrate binding protein [Falsiroseomonas sp.]|uniref:Bug family tripartite tricarboxylate transporter substrate binding protein n=1 Tax=Falsiroseomonas sp. TaxID=2870721 RepID=UPI0027272A84|nr:tripartite tricarboxylate transporter substrate binding protein [Falsiroseomonas sp.]MDO9501580.1 tripartite tricarboxylate transporter substrate binding protein [Falsiroseomonas sp.]MDP3417428.1 tripartite tricarboxylate transporter substrate binding protein [Falsiroseomonas sp.]